MTKDHIPYYIPTKHTFVARIDLTDRDGKRMESKYVSSETRPGFDRRVVRAHEEYWSRYKKEEVYIFTNTLITSNAIVEPEQFNSPKVTKH